MTTGITSYSSTSVPQMAVTSTSSSSNTQLQNKTHNAATQSLKRKAKNPTTQVAAKRIRQKISPKRQNKLNEKLFNESRSCPTNWIHCLNLLEQGADIRWVPPGSYHSFYLQALCTCRVSFLLIKFTKIMYYGGPHPLTRACCTNKYQKLLKLSGDPLTACRLIALTSQDSEGADLMTSDQIDYLLSNLHALWSLENLLVASLKIDDHGELYRELYQAVTKRGHGWPLAKPDTYKALKERYHDHDDILNIITWLGSLGISHWIIPHILTLDLNEFAELKRKVSSPQICFLLNMKGLTKGQNSQIYEIIPMFKCHDLLEGLAYMLPSPYNERLLAFREDPIFARHHKHLLCRAFYHVWQDRIDGHAPQIQQYNPYSLIYKPHKFSEVEITKLTKPSVLLLSIMASTKSKSADAKFFNKTSSSTFHKWFSLIFYNAEIARKFFDSSLTLETLEIWDRGEAKNTWEEYLRSWLKRIDVKTSVNLHPYVKVLHETLEEIPSMEAASITYEYFERFEKDGYKQVRKQGRTILYKHETDGTYLAFKWQKKNEPIYLLFKEFIVTLIFHNYGKMLGLKSRYPKPLGVHEISGPLPDDFFDGMDPIPWSNDPMIRRFVYVYKFPNESYFTYLHDETIGDKEFEIARENAMHDLFQLAQHTFLMTSLSDLFHNREQGRSDGGRYLPYPGLVMNDWRVGRGSGRLDRIWESIRYVNERGSGLADVGDSDFLKDLNTINHPLVRKHFRLLFDNADDRPPTENVLLTNFLGEYQLVDELIVGARARKLSQLSWDDEEKASKVGKQVLEGSVTGLSAYTRVSKRVTRRFVENAVDWTRYGKQMGFWMQNNAQGYVPHIKQGKIPEGIYDKDTNISVTNTRNLRGWRDNEGFVYDGEHPDLGTVNGPNPIKEGEKWRHIFPAFALQIEHNTRISKKKREEGEVFLKKTEAHKAMLAFQEALVLYPFCPIAYKGLAEAHRALGQEKEANYCLKESAALTIQKFYDRLKRNIPGGVSPERTDPSGDV